MKIKLTLYSVCLLAGCLFVATQPGKLWAQAPGKTPAVSVVVAPVTEGEMESSLYLVGTAYPLISTTVSAQVTGNIERFTIDEGTFVEEGEVLSQLEKTLKTIEVKRAKAQLNQTRAERLKLDSEINQAQFQVDSRTATLKKLELNKGRMDDLFSKDMVTLEQKQNAHLDFERGFAEVEEAKAYLNTKNLEIGVVEATKAFHEAEVAQAEYNLKKTNITAPFHGVITKKHKELGEWVSEGEAIVELINIVKILVHTNVAEQDIKDIVRGQPVEVIFDAYPDKLYQGSVKEIIPQADLKSRTFPIKIEVDNKEHKLYAGMFARLKLILGKKRKALLAPKDAILRADGGKYLFVIKNSTAHRVEVKTGREKENAVEVEGALEAGDKVVVTNNEVLRDNMPVVIAP